MAEKGKGKKSCVLLHFFFVLLFWPASFVSFSFLRLTKINGFAIFIYLFAHRFLEHLSHPSIGSSLVDENEAKDFFLKCNLSLFNYATFRPIGRLLSSCG